MEFGPKIFKLNIRRANLPTKPVDNAVENYLLSYITLIKPTFFILPNF